MAERTPGRRWHHPTGCPQPPPSWSAPWGAACGGPSQGRSHPTLAGRRSPDTCGVCVRLGPGAPRGKVGSGRASTPVAPTEGPGAERRRRQRRQTGWRRESWGRRACPARCHELGGSTGGLPAAAALPGGQGRCTRSQTPAGGTLGNEAEPLGGGGGRGWTRGPVGTGQQPGRARPEGASTTGHAGWRVGRAGGGGEAVPPHRLPAPRPAVGRVCAPG